MFENYKQMSADEKAQVKAIHKAIRAEVHSRAGNLAWAFVRGFPYRRVERKTRTQVLPDGSVYNYNPPQRRLSAILGNHIPGFATVDPVRKWATKAHPEIVSWLANPDGAIPAPPPREKKPYVAATAVA
jgi:hypothetical protein